MSTPGLVHIQCNGGHVWMNADMMVAPHPYYAVTEESGRLNLPTFHLGLMRSWPGMRDGAMREKKMSTMCCRKKK